MSVAIVTSDGALLCYLPGETPHVGDTLWLNGRLYSVDTVVRPLAVEEGRDKRAYSASMNLIIVGDITEEADSVLKLLIKLKRDGV